MITDKDIREALRKNRLEVIRDFHSGNNHGLKALADFMREKYGTGGWGSHSRDNSINRADYAKSGMTFYKTGGLKDEVLKLSWIKVAAIMQDMLGNENQMKLF